MERVRERPGTATESNVPQEATQAIAVSQLPYPETTVLKWHFPQENATRHDAAEDT
jgi:hypothetical protein